MMKIDPQKISHKTVTIFYVIQNVQKGYKQILKWSNLDNDTTLKCSTLKRLLDSCN